MILTLKLKSLVCIKISWEWIKTSHWFQFELKWKFSFSNTKNTQWINIGIEKLSTLDTRGRELLSYCSPFSVQVKQNENTPENCSGNDKQWKKDIEIKRIDKNEMTLSTLKRIIIIIIILKKKKGKCYYLTIYMASWSHKQLLCCYTHMIS